jgi:hypothetical protein
VAGLSSVSSHARLALPFSSPSRCRRRHRGGCLELVDREGSQDSIDLSLQILNMELSFLRSQLAFRKLCSETTMTEMTRRA